MTIPIEAAIRVSGLLTLPSNAHACLVLAHGAGAGMRHPFMDAVATELARHGIGTLRFQFPYMERGSRRTDPPALCHATVRAAVSAAGSRAPELPLFAGGKSFGGRMTSQAQALSPLAGVLGLFFLGFPLHPAKKPALARGEHLFDVHVPMLFLQGTNDELAERSLLEPLLKRLGARTAVKWFAEADHSFHVPARTGRKDAQIRNELVQATASWIGSLRTAGTSGSEIYRGPRSSPDTGTVSSGNSGSLVSSRIVPRIGPGTTFE